MYEKNFDKWIEDKKYLNNKRLSKHVRKGQIWWASLGVNVGVEIDGKKNHFERPVLIIKKIDEKSAFVIPLTSTIRENDNRFVVYKLDGVEKSAAIAQARMIDTKRLSRRAAFQMSSREYGKILDEFRAYFEK
ncbi:MAG: type II toxin-antitoxin system PemK/MazF family toxin [Streptococcaceae bacterium]|jgi:mRNA interferase MazF|nr:type II toxin-antitoxin system PemK/MazF family toxin [Streptococcaceae bacterium]